jgi:hypothetical protein
MSVFGSGLSWDGRGNSQFHAFSALLGVTYGLEPQGLSATMMRGPSVGFSAFQNVSALARGGIHTATLQGTYGAATMSFTAGQSAVGSSLVVPEGDADAGEQSMFGIPRWPAPEIPSIACVLDDQPAPDTPSLLPFLRAGDIRASGKPTKRVSSAPEHYAIVWEPKFTGQPPQAPRGQICALANAAAQFSVLYISQLCASLQIEPTNPVEFVAKVVEAGLALGVQPRETKNHIALLYATSYGLYGQRLDVHGTHSKWPVHWQMIERGFVRYAIREHGRLDRPPPPLMVKYWLQVGPLRCDFCLLPLVVWECKSGLAKARAAYENYEIPHDVPAFRVICASLGDQVFGCNYHAGCGPCLLATARQQAGTYLSHAAGGDKLDTRESSTWERTEPGHVGLGVYIQKIYSPLDLLRVTCEHQEELRRIDDGLGDSPTRLRRCWRCAAAHYRAEHQAPDAAAAPAEDRDTKPMIAALEQFAPNTPASFRRIQSMDPEARAEFIEARKVEFRRVARTEQAAASQKRASHWTIVGCDCAEADRVRVPMKTLKKTAMLTGGICPVCLKAGSRCTNARARLNRKNALENEKRTRDAEKELQTRAQMQLLRDQMRKQ